MCNILKIILILDIIAAVEILRSGKPMVEKLLWILFILFFPIIGKIFFEINSIDFFIIGLIVYLLCGRARSTGI
jgi:hypothetical protein